MKSVASVHRFGDKVAVFVGNSSTTYLTAKQARALSRALTDCAKSVVTEKFVDSSFGSRSIAPVSDEEIKKEVAKFPRNRK
jgi:ATP-dependent Clp protease ATP-binding subunit ClpA